MILNINFKKLHSYITFIHLIGNFTLLIQTIYMLHLR